MSATLIRARGATPLIATLCVLATACTTLNGITGSTKRSPAPPPAPTPAPEPEPLATPSGAAAPRPQSDASSASSALLAQSQAERAAGSYAQATASIERALRLDPNNAELWVERGELELQTGNAAQAATMARKALSLTGGNDAVAARAERLLRAAGAR